MGRIFLREIAAILTIYNHHYYFCWSLITPFLDPEHQRAKGNLKYFEFQLEKLKTEAADAPPTEKKLAKRETTEKIKKPKKKFLTPQLPERKKYEMLCRGEGIRMVRKAKRHAKT